MPPDPTDYIDVFNGDADGLCAMHQLRLAEPRAARVVTGTKRDIELLSRVQAGPGVGITVCDISLSSNRRDLDRLLAGGASVRWFDHHHAGDLPSHPNFEAHIDEGRDVCSALLVDRWLGQRHARWAVTAAYGDNLVQVADRYGERLGLSHADLQVLRNLGENLNYNAYGDSVDDLLVPPAVLFEMMRPYPDPLRFAAESEPVRRIDAGRREDLSQALQVRPSHTFAHGDIVILPQERWSRRVRGALGNALAERDAGRAQAILTPDDDDGFVVSVRLPHGSGSRADALCRGFSGGGGRAIAAGINHLPTEQLGLFVRRFGELEL